jgi:hypothetical protein
MTVGRVLLIVFGSIIALLGLALLAGGSVLLYADIALKGDDGYFTTRTERYRTPSRAIVTEKLDLTGVPGGSGQWADLRIHAHGVGGRPVFVGIGRKADVQRYLAGVAHAELTDVDLDPFRPTYTPHPGTRAPAPPAQQSIWDAKVQGSGPQTLTWGVTDGDWQIVAMNPTGRAGVAVDASAGVKIGHVTAIVTGLLVVGFLVLGGGIVMIVFGARRRRRPSAPAPGPATAQGASRNGG